MLIKRPHYRPIPPRAEIITDRKGQRLARWTNAKGRAVSVPLNERGDRIVVESRRWYVRLQDADGRWFERRAYTDRTASEVLHAELATKVERGQVGMIDPMDEHRKRPLVEHLDAFEQHLESRENTGSHVELTMQRVRTIAASIQAKVIAGITPGRVEECLKDLRRQGLPPKGKGKRRPLSLSSSNHYLRAIRTFCNWLVRDRRIEANPLAGLSALKAEKDLKRRRRALTEEEAIALVEAARNSVAAFRDLSSQDRAMLYEVAMSSGLRASELASLTAESLDFANVPATIRVLAGYSKHREEDIQPLPAELAGRLEVWARGRRPGAPLWPGSWSEKAARMVRLDLDVARTKWLEASPSQEVRKEREQGHFLAYMDGAGRVADFHSLRHTFISNLARGGVHPKIAMELARHKKLDLTMGVYTHVLHSDKAAALDVLPSLAVPNEAQQAAVLANTGTDGPDPDPGDGPKRRTKRRVSGGSSCGNMANGGERWREAGPQPGDQTDGRNSSDVRRIDEACPSVASPVSNAPGAIRTLNLRIRSPLLYPLSYGRKHKPATRSLPQPSGDFNYDAAASCGKPSSGQPSHFARGRQ